MSTTQTLLPKNFHSAVEKWRDTFLPDYDILLDNWERFFPREPRFQLCAFRECGMCGEIECGDAEGQPKHAKASAMPDEHAGHMLAAIRAQASTEFGSVQQHRLTLARAQNEEDQFWILRMMAEEIRHGYQMLHLLLEDDWSNVSQQSGADMVEEILSMRTGSHILGAFNIDFDSFVDNVVFCALIDRVGKYQLAMQKISAYQPMAESMPQMLREEAFHLAAGVVPMRRWMKSAAKGDIFITIEMMQKVLNKWLPRGLEMFGHELGGGTNVRFGLKPMRNAEAQQLYYDEVVKLMGDLNMRYVRERLPSLSLKEAEDLMRRVGDGETVQGVRREDLLHAPHQDFFRRRGVPAFEMIGWEGEVFDDVEAYKLHLAKHLPESYLATRDFKTYFEALQDVASGGVESQAAAARMPTLSRVAATCPCSRAVRWVVEDSNGSSLENVVTP